MDKFFGSLPKNMVALLAIVGGILLIVLLQPPHSVCDSQIAAFKEAEKTFLYRDPKSKQIKTTKYERLFELCRGSNNPGGCYELFQKLKTFFQNLEAMTPECAPKIHGVAEVKRALWESTELMVKLAWGDVPPTSYHAKFGWLDSADISLFCKMKERVVSFYGESAWTGFRERMMRELPGAKDLQRNQVWDFSILSENCARYP